MQKCAFATFVLFAKTPCLGLVFLETKAATLGPWNFPKSFWTTRPAQLAQLAQPRAESMREKFPPSGIHADKMFCRAESIREKFPPSGIHAGKVSPERNPCGQNVLPGGIHAGKFPPSGIHADKMFCRAESLRESFPRAESMREKCPPSGIHAGKVSPEDAILYAVYRRFFKNISKKFEKSSKSFKKKGHTTILILQLSPYFCWWRSDAYGE